MSFSESFKNARIKANLTQQQIADELGLDRSAISHYELGDSKPTFDSIPKICKLLNISVDELLK